MLVPFFNNNYYFLFAMLVSITATTQNEKGRNYEKRKIETHCKLVYL